MAFAAVVLAAALLLGDAAVRGSWAVVLRMAGPALLIAWAAWMLLFRPSIRVRADRAVVINLGRITEVPWSRVAEIQRRLQLIFELDDGRRVEAWGSPFVSKRPTGGKPVVDDALDALRAAWQSAAPSSAAVVRRTDTVSLLIGIAALALAVLCVGVVP